MLVTREDIVDVIRKAKAIEAPESLRPEMNITEQGVDSLGLFSIVLAVQDAYGIANNDAEVDQLHTLNDLVAYANTHRA
ncbi:acyl carrier protein [compost metagenome]